MLLSLSLVAASVSFTLGIDLINAKEGGGGGGGAAAADNSRRRRRRRKGGEYHGGSRSIVIIIEQRAWKDMPMVLLFLGAFRFIVT